MAEICSAYPQAGSVYYWAGQLAPVRWAPYASFMVGWINMMGNLANSATFASGCLTIVAAAAAMRDGTVISMQFQVGLSIALLALWSVQNFLRIDWQGYMNAAGSVVQVVGSILVVIVALVMSPARASGETVFLSTYNGTGIRSFGYVACIGLLAALYSYGGFEAGAHMAEETRHASKVAPRGVVTSVVISLFAGIFLLVGLLYCTPTDAAAQALGYPTGIDLLLSRPCRNATSPGSGCYVVPGPAPGPGSVPNEALINLFWYASGRTVGFFLSLLVALLVFSSGMAAVTATSRVVFAMARDNALPLSRYFSVVQRGSGAPVNAVLLVFAIDAMLLLLPLGDVTAFDQITSMSSIGYVLSYGAPILLRITTGRSVFRPGWFSLGRLSYPVGWLAVLWCAATPIILLLPQVAPVTSSNMNYASVVVAATVLLAQLYWWTVARYTFAGPQRADADATPA